MHRQRHLPERRLHRRPTGHVRAVGPVPCPRNLRSDDWRMQQPAGTERHGLHPGEQLARHLPERRLPGDDRGGRQRLHRRAVAAWSAPQVAYRDRRGSRRVPRLSSGPRQDDQADLQAAPRPRRRPRPLLHPLGWSASARIPAHLQAPGSAARWLDGVGRDGADGPQRLAEAPSSPHVPPYDPLKMADRGADGTGKPPGLVRRLLRRQPAQQGREAGRIRGRDSLTDPRRDRP